MTDEPEDIAPEEETEAPEFDYSALIPNSPAMTPEEERKIKRGIVGLGLAMFVTIFVAWGIWHHFVLSGPGWMAFNKSGWTSQAFDASTWKSPQHDLRLKMVRRAVRKLRRGEAYSEVVSDLGEPDEIQMSDWSIAGSPSVTSPQQTEVWYLDSAPAGHAAKTLEVICAGDRVISWAVHT